MPSTCNLILLETVISYLLRPLSPPPSLLLHLSSSISSPPSHLLHLISSISSPLLHLISSISSTPSHPSHQLVGVDVADVSVKQAQDRFKTLGRQQDRSLFTAEFHCVDTCKESILNVVDDKSIRFDLTSCQFVYNYSFDTYPRAEAMLTNACRYLKMGGFFIGRCPVCAFFCALYASSFRLQPIFGVLPPSI